MGLSDGRNTAPQFDYYMRLDGGDSRLDMVAVDPFLHLKENSLRRARAASIAASLAARVLRRVPAQVRVHQTRQDRLLPRPH